MKNQVTIVPNETGAKIRVSKNNSDYGHVLLKQEKTIIGTNGWVKTTRLHALLHGEVDDLKSIGIKKMKTLPGQIIVKESTTPFNEKNPDMDLKYAGKTGIVCCRDGEPIYRRALYDASMTETDEFIAHTNGDDIRAANNENAEKALQANTEFSTSDNQVELPDMIAECEEEEQTTSEITEDELTEVISEEDEVTIDEEEDVTFEL
tara:strand:+ start:1859 stop:2476 length:618 start_codon:yes stop_codon:yes gene_type:complete